MPHSKEDDARNVVLNTMDMPFTEYALDAEAMAKWDTLIALRNDVNGVLELARTEKRIGKPLDASVVLHASGEASSALESVRSMNLSELFIVSNCLFSDEDVPGAVVGSGSAFPGLTVSVREAEGAKCPRCWIHSEQADPETGLCPRCSRVVASLS